MKLAYFTHSLQSCWNHGNAHFLRGVLRELMAMGHEVLAYEPQDAWSLVNLLGDHGQVGLECFGDAYPELRSEIVTDEAGVERACAEADVVIVHEWNEPALAARIGRLRARGGGFTLLFHDTHHRAVSEPEAMRAYDLSAYDGVLAFGETLSEVYRGSGWGECVWTWHEAADARLFRPPAEETARDGIVWIGNWGDGERTEELEGFLFRPAQNAGLPLDIYGVRYPDAARATLGRYGARYHGWLANPKVPAVFSRHRLTVHVPRRFYVERLPGIPTIRVFEALACGVPLVSAPWSDSENLFRPGQDFLFARDGAEMTAHMRALQHDPGLRASLAASGLETIRARHTCAHRAQELLDVVAGLRAPSPSSAGEREVQAPKHHPLFPGSGEGGAQPQAGRVRVPQPSGDVI